MMTQKTGEWGEERSHHFDELNEKMREWIAAGAFPGCVYGVIGKKSTFSSLGKSMITPEERVNKLETLYDLASLTKVVGTVPAILHLVEAGELTLGTRIASILPEVGESQVTVEQCLTHTSGAPADFSYQELSGKQALIERATSLLPLEGSNVICYSDINYILLGEVIERVSGMSLDQAFHKWIFQPLGMMDTGFDPEHDRCAPTEVREDRGLVWGQAHDGKAHMMGGISGHAGLFSTGSDLGRFVAGILESAKGGNDAFLSSASIQLMAKQHASSTHDRRGLGWMLPIAGGPMGDYCSENSLFHTGFTGGSILIDLDREVGIVLLTNRIHPRRENRMILDLRPRFHNMAIVALDRM
jgi:CubicO group peptidase (beta-lactamase class C family)